MLSCNTVAYPNSSLERALAGISNAGFKYVELAATVGIVDHLIPEKMNNQDYKILHEALDSYNLKTSTVAGQVIYEAAGVNLLRYNVQMAIQLTKNRIDSAAKLGALRVIVSAGEVRNESENKIFYKNMKKLGDYAQKKGVVLALETNRGITSTGKKSLEVMDNIDHTTVGINFDTGNIKYFSGENPEDNLEVIMPYIVHMHLKDIRGTKGSYEVSTLGDGDINFKKIFNILDKYNFEGPFSVEAELQQRQTQQIIVKESTIDNVIKKSYKFLQQFKQE